MAIGELHATTSRQNSIRISFIHYFTGQFSRTEMAPFLRWYVASSPSTFCLLFIRKPATYRPTTRTCLCNLQRPRNQPSHMLLVFRPESSSRCNAHHSYTILITSTSIILLSAVLRRRRRGSSAIPAVYPNHVCVLFVSYPEGQAIPNRKCTTTWG